MQADSIANRGAVTECSLFRTRAVIGWPTVKKNPEYEEPVGADSAGKMHTKTHKATWTATWGPFTSTQDTRKGAIEHVQLQIDASRVKLPELDAVFRRWAESIQALVPMLKNDMQGHADLIMLKSSMSMAESMFRRQAVEVEEQIAKLRQRAASMPADDPQIEAAQ